MLQISRTPFRSSTLKAITSASTLAILASVTTFANAEPPKYRVVEFDKVLGEHTFTGDKINNQGSVIGRFSTGAAFGYEPALLIKDKYHILPDGFQTDRMLMTAINDRNIIVGWEESSMPSGQAFASNGRLFKSLGTLNGGYSYAFDVNNRGTIVGNSDARGVGAAFIWSKGKMAELQPLSDGYSYGIAVNDNNDAVGFSWDDEWQSRAVLWPANGSGPIQLTGDVERGFPETAVDINEQGQVVGDVAVDDPESFVHAFRWEDNVLTDLGVLPEAGQMGPYGRELLQTRAKAINDLGQVVGNSEPHFPDPDFDTRPGPFLWENGEMFNLNDHLRAEDVDQYVISGAIDINNQGVILATVNDDDLFNRRSVLLVPVK